MKLAHLILAHDHPEQLARLVDRLLHRGAHVYIHLDAKAPIEAFNKIIGREDVFFITNRVKVYWGAFSIVQATINGFKQIDNSGKHYDYVNLLSGHDYPIAPTDKLYDLLAANQGKAYMNSRVAETHWLEALPRVQQYYFDNYRFPLKYAIQKTINKLLPKRKLPDDMVLVGRSQWFTIAGDCVKYILDYWDSHPAFRRFMKFTWAPDEFIFQTILYNSPLRERMVDEDLRYIDWQAGGARPKTLTMDDVEALKQSGKFFARKFDMNKDAAVLKYIDEHFLSI